jgi:hypothetical protein
MQMFVGCDYAGGDDSDGDGGDVGWCWVVLGVDGKSEEITDATD